MEHYAAVNTEVRNLNGFSCISADMLWFEKISHL